MAIRKEETRFSVSPAGKKYAIPQQADYDKELKRIKTLVDKAKK